MMGITDWLFRRSRPCVPQPPSRQQEARRNEREQRTDDRIRAQVRAELQALNERMERIARSSHGR